MLATAARCHTRSIFGEVLVHGHRKFEAEGQFDANLDAPYRELSWLRGLRELETINCKFPVPVHQNLSKKRSQRDLQLYRHGYFFMC
jgi:hypothetical protein